MRAVVMRSRVAGNSAPPKRPLRSGRPRIRRRSTGMAAGKPAGGTRNAREAGTALAAILPFRSARSARALSDHPGRSGRHAGADSRPGRNCMKPDAPDLPRVGCLSVVVEQELFFTDVFHVRPELITGSSARRIFRTARKMLCLVALARWPSTRPISRMDIPSKWRSTKSRTLQGAQTVQCREHDLMKFCGINLLVGSGHAVGQRRPIVRLFGIDPGPGDLRSAAGLESGPANS